MLSRLWFMRCKACWTIAAISLIWQATTVRADDREVVQLATNGTTVLLVRVDSGKVELPPQLKDILAKGSMRASLEMFSSKLKELRASMRDGTGYLAVDLPYSVRMHARLLSPNQVDQQQVMAWTQSVWSGSVGKWEPNAKWLRLPLGSDPESAAAGQPNAAAYPVQVEDWTAGLAVTHEYPVQCVVVVPSYVAATFREVEPSLPPAFGGGSSLTLVAGVRWMSLGIDPNNLRARLVVQSESAEAAAALKGYLPKLYSGLLKESKLDQVASTMVMAVLGMLQPKVQGDQLVLSFENAEQASAVMELFNATLTAASSSMAKVNASNNLKQLMLAIHNFESANSTLPTYVELRTRKVPSGLSWRVHILPYIEELELYNQFKLDEPWDSPHNIKLLDKMPTAFKPEVALGSDVVIPPTHTTYLAPVGEHSIFGRDKPIGFANVVDGTSNTIAIVEVKPEHAIPWTSPEDYRYDPQNPAAKLRVTNGKVLAALLDGSVQSIPVDAPWGEMFTIDGGEVIKW